MGAIVCLLVVGGCGVRGGDESKEFIDGVQDHIGNQLGVVVTLECPELVADKVIECAGRTEADHAFTVTIEPDGDNWIRGEVRGILSGNSAAKQLRGFYRADYGIELTSLHCPDLLTEGVEVTCRAHADTHDFDIRATLTGTDLKYDTDGLVLMAEIEKAGVALFVARGAEAVIDCGHPRGRVKRIGSSFSCSAVVAGQSAFVDVVITADAPKLMITGWDP